MSFLNYLLNELTGKGTQAPQRHQIQPQAQQAPISGVAQGMGMNAFNNASAPDITYDPSGQTPYSARTPQLAQIGNAYTANPTAPQFQGVDPAQFGYPADNTMQPQSYQSPIQGAQNPQLAIYNPTRFKTR